MTAINDSAEQEANSCLECPECGAQPGQMHADGCDVERCPRCGGQAISCDCIYEACGMELESLEQKHPDIYSNGPTDAMREAWDKEWGTRRIPWTGEWPGVAECREFGWYAKLGPTGWESCGHDEEGARENLNRLRSGEAQWDRTAQRWVKRKNT